MSFRNISVHGVRGPMPQMRRVALSVIPSIAMLVAGASSVAYAQNVTNGDGSSSSAFSSSADGIAPAAAPEPAAAGKPAAGQADNSYGYHHHNWGSRLAFEAGGGANGPTGDSSNDITWGGNLTVGAGYKINSHLAGLIEYQFIDDKLPGRLISDVGATGGNAHIWSFTLAPVVDLFPKRTNDIYITGGGGFYRKVTNFTDPQEGYYCYYYYCGIDVENVVVGHYSSNQGGWNIGAGFTHRLGGIYGDGNVKLFAEARYLDVLSPASAIAPNGLGVAVVGSDTKLVPITLGVRF
jgi:hypothetical protein